MKNYLEWLNENNTFISILQNKYNKIKNTKTNEIFNINWNDKDNHNLYKKIEERGTSEVKEFTKAVMRMLRLFLKFSNNAIEYYEYIGLSDIERNKIAIGQSKLKLFNPIVSKKNKLLRNTYFITMRKSNYNIPVTYDPSNNKLIINTILGINQKSNDKYDIPMQFQEELETQLELIFDL